MITLDSDIYTRLVKTAKAVWQIRKLFPYASAPTVVFASSPEGTQTIRIGNRFVVSIVDLPQPAALEGAVGCDEFSRLPGSKQPVTLRDSGQVVEISTGAYRGELVKLSEAPTDDTLETAELQPILQIDGRQFADRAAQVAVAAVSPTLLVREETASAHIVVDDKARIFCTDMVAATIAPLDGKILRHGCARPPAQLLAKTAKLWMRDREATVAVSGDGNCGEVSAGCWRMRFDNIRDSDLHRLIDDLLSRFDRDRIPSLTVQAGELAAAAARCARNGEHGDITAMALYADPDTSTVKLTHRNTSTVEIELPAIQIAGKPVEVALSPRYVAKLLEPYRKQTVCLKIVGELKPILIEAEDGSSILIMPMRRIGS